MNKPIATKIYNLYSRFYGAAEIVFRKRLARALAAVPFQDGQRVLDIGVGTGLSLEFYPPAVHVTGIDLSSGMLHQAQKKLAARTVRSDCRPDATQLLQADALQLPFANNSFDIVLLSHVISTVPNPARCLEEALRVARDSSTIIIVNHFRNPLPVINWIETAIDPICRKLGWRSDLSLEELLTPLAIENLPAARHAKGFLFRIAYLQKRRTSLRLISLPLPTPQKPTLETA